MEQRHVAWGAAAMLLKRHGDQVPVVVATRIGTLVAARNMDVVAIKTYSRRRALEEQWMAYPMPPLNKWIRGRQTKRRIILRSSRHLIRLLGNGSLTISQIIFVMSGIVTVCKSSTIFVIHLTLQNLTFCLN
tara:strand:+ start:3253 stop:3648 length:396 start_codon:yes stop_codon:yes gene_type:complete